MKAIWRPFLDSGDFSQLEEQRRKRWRNWSRHLWIGPISRSNEASACLASPPRRRNSSPPDPLLTCDLRLFKNGLQQVDADVLAAMRIRDGDLDVSLRHMRMLGPRDWSLPAKLPKALDEIGAGDGREAHRARSNKLPAQVVTKFAV